MKSENLKSFVIDNKNLLELKDLISKNELMGEVINDISVEDEQVYFKDPERLLTILSARAYMHNIVYLNPEVHAREHVM